MVLAVTRDERKERCSSGHTTDHEEKNALLSRRSWLQALMRGTAGSVLLKAAHVLIQFGTSVFLARVLSPVGLGIYGFSLALVNVLVMVAQFGFPVFLVRAVSTAVAEHDYVEVRGLIRDSSRAVTTLSLVIIGLSTVWLCVTDATPGDVPKEVLGAALVLVVPLALSPTYGGAIRGLGYIIQSQLADDILRPMGFFLILVLVTLVGGRLTPHHVLVVSGAVGWIVLAYIMRVLRKHIPELPAEAVIQPRYLNRLAASFPYLLLAAAHTVNHQIDILMLGFMTSQEEVGYYRVGVQVAGGMSLFMYGFSVTIAPQIARLHAEGNWARLQHLLVLSHRVAAAVMAVLATGVIFLRMPMLELVFGRAYLPAAPATIILAVAKVFYGTVGFSGLALSMLGRPTVALFVTVGTSLLNFLLNLILVPRWGTQGAAIATGISEFVVSWAGVIWILRVYGKNLSAFASVGTRVTAQSSTK